MASQPRFRAAIFDFDGVIADSIPLHFEAFSRLFAEEGVTFTLEDYWRLANGLPRDLVIQAVLGDLPAEKKQELMDRKGHHVFSLLEERGLEPIPGSLEMVQALRERGLHTAIASSSQTAREFLEAMRIHDQSLAPPTKLFEAILEGGGTRTPKPDPEVFLLAAEAVGVAPEECLAFEDSVKGVKAARAAGMRVVALTTTENREALGEADLVFGSFGEIDPDQLLSVHPPRLPGSR